MKLSIIVPVYGVANYLCKCIDSLLEQDIEDYEIILVDDGSPDECPNICDEYAEKNTNIKAIHQENKGLSEARNTGTRVAQGNYIMYVDSDDYLQPNVLGALMEQVKRDQLDVLRFRYQNVRESGEAFAPYKDMTNYNDYSSIPTDGLTFLNERMGTQCYAWQFLLKTELALKELFTRGIYFEDTDWTPRMLLRAKRVASTDLVVYNYLWREGSITLSQKDIAKQRKQLQDKMGLLERLNQWGNQVSDRRWFDSMISSLVVNIVGMLAGPFYAERIEYIKRIKTLGILPITTNRIAPRAKRKVRLINFSVELSIKLIRLYFLLKNELLKKYGYDCWALGFIEGGIQQIMENDTYEVKWVKVPKERWYADPFILDVTDTEILVLVEDYAYDYKKGVISLLHINRQTMEVVQRKVILEIPTHLSFPNILRKNGNVYIYPESAHSGQLDIYKFDFDSESLTHCATICNDCIWDSDITDVFGDQLLFTAAHNDYLLDIYHWNESEKRFVLWKSIPSEIKNSRLGGALFKYKDRVYYPAQNCEKGYGCAINIKEIEYKNGDFLISDVKTIKSTHKRYNIGLHTLNEYKGVAVIDVHGYRYGVIGKLITSLVKVKKYLNKYL